MGIETEDDDMDRETAGRKLVEELPPEMLKEFTEIFSFFDRYGMVWYFLWSISKYHELVERDGGGSIGAEELEQVLHHPPNPPEELLDPTSNIRLMNGPMSYICDLKYS